MSLKQYRGKAVILAFIDAECQTLCPLTTTAMLDAKRSLGPAGKDVQLLGINVNWKSTQIDDVLNYTRLHGLTRRMALPDELVPAAAGAVWKEYGVNEKSLIADDTNNIDHVAAVYVIDPQGGVRTLFTTQNSYSAIPQFGQLLAAGRLASCCRAIRRFDSHYSYRRIVGITPSQSATAPALGRRQRHARSGQTASVRCSSPPGTRRRLTLRPSSSGLDAYAALRQRPAACRS